MIQMDKLKTLFEKIILLKKSSRCSEANCKCILDFFFLSERNCCLEEGYFGIEIIVNSLVNFFNIR